MNNLMDTVKQRATTQLDTQKDRATDGLHVIANAVRQTTTHLRNERHEGFAQYVDRAADQLDRFSDTIRNKDVSELLHDARDVARRQPALFIGGSFAVGLLAARFLKSSQRDGEHSEQGYSHDGASTRAYAAGSIADRSMGNTSGVRGTAYPERDRVADVDAWTRDASEIDRGRF